MQNPCLLVVLRRHIQIYMKVGTHPKGFVRMVCFQMQHAEVDFPRSEVYSEGIHGFLTFVVFIGHIQLHLIIKVHILEMTSGK